MDSVINKSYRRLSDN